MRFLSLVMAVLGMMFGPLNFLAIPGLASYGSSRPTVEDILNAERNAETAVAGETEALNGTEVAEGETATGVEGTDGVIEMDYQYTGNTTVDLEGYCTLEYPSSHFSESARNSTATSKYLLYKDNKSRIQTGFVTDLLEDTDVMGYIVQQIAGVGTSTNDHSQIDYSGKTFTVVNATEPQEGRLVKVYYCQKGQSAFWATAEVVPESSGDEWQGAVDAVMNSVNIYYLTGGSVFQTPSVGYYENYEDDNDSSGKQQDAYRSQSIYETVFKGRGGYIEGADIPTSWDCMQLILDGQKIYVPDVSYDYLTNIGYELYNSKALKKTNDGQYYIAPGVQQSFDMINSNGTVVTLTLINTNVDTIATLNECAITKFVIDRSAFVPMANGDVQIHEEDVAFDSSKFEDMRMTEIAAISPKSRLYNSLTPEEKAYVDEVTEKMSAGYYKYPRAYYGTENANKLWTEEEMQQIRNGIDLPLEPETETETEETETVNETELETVTDEEAVETEVEETSEDSEASETETEVVEETEEVLETETETEEKIEVDATLILPGGITWEVYTDDLQAFYGGGSLKSIGNRQVTVTFKKDTYTMTLTMGMLQGINKIEYDLTDGD